jgi:hypothetical protein
MRWNAAIVEMDRYYKTPVLYRNMGIEMFVILLMNKRSQLFTAYFGDETKTKS